MNTTSDRKIAKQDIVSTEENDPDLDASMEEAKSLQLETLRELHRHKEKQAKAPYGLGGFLGSEQHAPNNIAFIALLLGFIGFLSCCSIAVYVDKESIDFWLRNSERSLTLSITALAHIFGRGSNT